MATSPEEEDEDIGASVLPAVPSEPAVPLPLVTLMPWHHPRKQYVRERQWQLYTRSLVQKLVERAQLPAGIVNYLTLPGIDYFDVELIGQAVQDVGVKLQMTGFLAEAEVEPVRARSQFREETLIKQGLIEDSSVTFPYRFEDLANERSQAFREVKSRAPFHVINVDACGSVATPTGQHAARIIDSILGLITLQFNRCRAPWLLFLTTDARLNNLSNDVLDALKAAIRQNAAESEAFAAGAISTLANDQADEIEAAFEFAENMPDRFLSMFGLGFSKWLLHNADGAGWDVKAKQFYCYSTTAADNDDPSMCCLALEFSPRQLAANDIFAAAAVAGQAAPADPPDYSMKALERAQGMVNLDGLLAEDATLKSELAARQRSLLEQVGYQAAALEEFDARFG